MADKQIIIDGVNVSGCTYSKIGIDKKNYCEQDLYDDGTPVFTCDECTNCYYKQLKRKEQECEELKDKLNCCFCNPYVELNDIVKQRKCVEVTECFRRKLDQLKAERKELKETIKLQNKMQMEVCEEKNEEIEKLKAENEKIKESRDYYKRIVDGCPDVCENGFCQIDFYNKKLSKTITEIKDIAEKDFRHTAWEEYAKQLKQILQKISECEVENAR